MPEETPSPLMPGGAYFLCVNTAPSLRAVLRESSPAASAPTDLVEAANTYAARSWLASLQREPQFRSTPPPALVFVGYTPEEHWSLAVLLSQLQDLDPRSPVQVVLIADGPAYVLPISVTDYPRLRVVPLDFLLMDRLNSTVRGLVVEAVNSTKRCSLDAARPGA